uniref:Carbohydrate sulfotransferase n=1 Tax=Strongyloides stercoralis TaxID=6248 RepID=A0A0K0ECD6_STRER
MEQKIIYLNLFILIFFILTFYGISKLEFKTNLFIETVQSEAIDLLYDPIVSLHNMAYSYVIKDYNKKIAYCVLPKNLSTKMKKFMEILKGSKIIHNKSYKNDSDFVNNKTYELVSYNKRKEIIVNNEEWFWFTIQRNPIERFISSFVDKCINEGFQKKFGYETCYGCHKDIHCFLSIQIMRARLLIKNSSYIEESYEDRHFMPQAWFCNFKNYKDKILTLPFEEKENIFYQLKKVTVKRGFDENFIVNLIKNILMKKTPHTTSKSEIRKKIKKQIYDDKNLLRNIYNLYYIDYKVFGYQRPKELD